jgi:hypothetical protein
VLGSTGVGLWTTTTDARIILGATDYRNSGAFSIKDLSWHEDADINAAIILGATVNLDYFERIFAHVPGVMTRSLASATSSTALVTLYFDEPLPDATYSVYVSGGKNSDSITIVWESNQLTTSFGLFTRLISSAATINPQTTTMRYLIMVVYNRTIVLNNLCTVLGSTLTILGGST